MKATKYSFQKIAFVGNYIPRRCGIATFTTDLCESVTREVPGINCVAAAMNDTPEGYAYPDQVRFEIAQNDVEQYRELADFLNMGQVDVACIQHEYGIFGGQDGEYILEFLRRLRKPVVTTLHTVLFSPYPNQRRIVREIAGLCSAVVVMVKMGRDMLINSYGIPPEKIVVVPHGVPNVHRVRAATVKKAGEAVDLLENGLVDAIWAGKYADNPVDSPPESG